MEKLETENDLTLIIKNNENVEIVNEQCCTILTVSLNNSGDVYTTFLGAYNKDVLKLLEKSQRNYYKSLMKKLKNNQIPNMESSEALNELSVKNNKTETSKKIKKTKKTENK